MLEENLHTANITSSADDCLFLQPLWDWMLQYAFYIGSPVFLYTLSFTSSFMCEAFSAVVEFSTAKWPQLNRYRTKPGVEFSWPRLKPVMMKVFVWRILLYEIPFLMFQWPALGEVYLPTKAPSVLKLIWQVIVTLILMDAMVYFVHVAYHKVHFLYKYIHSVHHQNMDQMGLLAFDVHPVEFLIAYLIIRNIMNFVGCHPLSEYFVVIFLALALSEGHLGFDFPFMTQNFVPFWGGSLMHQYHHTKPNTNFQTVFCYLDLLFGTYYTPNKVELKNVKN